MGSLEQALQRALAVRLNLQISLSQLPIIEEWMDIHLDRWLEHNPTPADLPDGEEASYLAMLGTDLHRMWWGSWGEPRGFVPQMADYFKLCNIARSDAALLDQIGEQLEPRLVGSWIGVWGGKVRTGWHFRDPQPWTAIEALFGTHEAKYQLKKFVEAHGISQIERFAQSIGDGAYSELELALPGATVDEQVAALSNAFEHFAVGPLDAALVEALRGASAPTLSLSVRIRGGQIVRVGGLAPGVPLDELPTLCAAARVELDPKLDKLVGALGGTIARVEYGRAGERAGLDVFVEPGQGAQPAPVPPSQAN